MIIGLCGPHCAGKTTIANYLVEQLNFQLITDTCQIRPAETEPHPAPITQPLNPHNNHNDPSTNGSTNGSLSPNHHPCDHPPRFTHETAMECWRPNMNLVIDSITPFDPILTQLLKRPFFLLIYVDAPLLTRFQRSRTSQNNYPQDFQSFALLDDRHSYLNFIPVHPHPPTDPIGIDCHNHYICPPPAKLDTKSPKCHQYSMARLQALARLRLVNVAPTLPALLQALANITFTDDRLLRPGWDSYFMKLAQLASERTNCIKRRVGCVIARNRRLIATGYNGTASGLPNCNAGGCARCNGMQHCQGERLDLCLCLHAEENAIIEAGRERCEGSTLYTNLFPCVLCAKKIVQAGVARVVFDTHYSSDGTSQRLLSAGGVKVDSFDGDDGSRGLWEIILTCH